MTGMQFPYHLFSVLLLAGCATSKPPAPAQVPPMEAVIGITAPAATDTNASPGFIDHGIATPVSENRGTVAAVDGAGRNVALVWLNDIRGGYGLQMIDVESGRSEQWPTPFNQDGDTPFSSVLSRGNRYYTHFGKHFCEFDPVKRAFTFVTNTAPQMAMVMIEDDQGVIWSATYPQSGLVSFDPKTRVFKDYGQLYLQNWPQYPTGLCRDDAGWVYWAIGSTMGQVLAFDPQTGKKATPLIPEDKRKPGGGNVFRADNGKVYASGGALEGWLECQGGRIRKIEGKPPARQAPNRSERGRSSMQFPDGRRLASVDLAEHVLAVEGPGTGEVNRVSFDYATEGSVLISMIGAPDGTVCGSTTHTGRFYSFNPRTGEWIRRPIFKTWTVAARQGDRVFIASYTGGFLQEWDPTRDWVHAPGRTNSNPRILTQCAPVINAPRRILTYPDGNTLVVAGRPGYGRTGGGLLFWDRQAGKGTLLAHTNVIPDLITFSLVALPNGTIMGGMSTQTGQGGEVKAKEAQVYIMDMASKTVKWHQPLFPGVQCYTDLVVGPDGLVYGFADKRLFFVFDPLKRKVIHSSDTAETFGPTVGMHPFVAGPAGTIYVLFEKGIGRLKPETREIVFLARSPMPITCSGPFLDSRLFFGCGSHVYSYDLSAAKRTPPVQ